MDIQDGGPAFPGERPSGQIEYVEGVGNRHVMESTEGMSLRDYFAARALTAFMQWELSQLPEGDADSRGAAAARYSKQAYVIADAMLAARSA
ncbi:hypothetical protein [Pseudomonas sp. T8]|uniref:hypothetical protein n=1 Tax=Pseudomonas sp. T8 TaxID=645292 RepID=UPI0021490997|nr:hypothetical protein [Pseudomonas sp. T8]UUT22119.1 hypothetical protein NRG23_31265 [Pseudomonas sp. T8]